MTAAETAALQRAVDDLVARWRSLDPVRLAAVFPEDARFTDVTGFTAVGPEAIAQQHTLPFTRLFRNAQVDVGEVAVQFVTPDSASVRLPWTMRGHTTAQGGPLPPRHGLMHVVLARRASGWQPVVVHNTDHTALDPAPSEPGKGQGGA